MKVLVATKETQGKRKNDFSWTDEGEIVTFGFECDGEKVDGKCGCKRSLCGTQSHKATTTMKVVEKDITASGFEKIIAKSLFDSGWIKENKVTDWVKSDAKELLKLANSFPVNSIIEKRGDKFQTRG